MHGECFHWYPLVKDFRCRLISLYDTDMEKMTQGATLASGADNDSGESYIVCLSTMVKTYGR
jgi:hypothetical protein